MLPSSRTRVPRHTASADNRSIQRGIEKTVQHFAAHPQEIERRLNELDDEWDIERAIEMNASVLALSGVVAGALHDRRWLIFSSLVTGFLLQHAVQGWCPPVPILRKLGFRTVYEIEQERQALKAVRGDFAKVTATRKKRTRTRGRKARLVAATAVKAAA